MSTTRIDEIIEYLTNNGLAPEDFERNNISACLNYDSYYIDIDLIGSELNTEFLAPLDRHTGFGQSCVNFINSFTTDWEIYEGYLKIRFNTKDKQNLLDTLERCIARFVRGE